MTDVVIQQGGNEVVLVSGGAPGLSHYQLARANGFDGTESEWLASLVGPAGASAYEVAVANGFEGDASAWLQSLIGQPGLSAYDVAVADGFTGTPSQWLDTLRGVAGASAYEIAVAEGYQGTQVDWLLSLVGAPGADAYAVAVSQGFPGTPAEWLQSLVGAQGLSAYQVAITEGFAGTAGEWLDSLKGDPGDPGGIVNLRDAPYVPSWFSDILAGTIPVDATSVGEAIYDSRFSVADVFYALNGRMPDHGDNIGPAVNIVADTVRSILADFPTTVGSRGAYRPFTVYMTLGVIGKLLYTDVTLNLSQLRTYGGVTIDFHSCPIELRTPGKEGVNTLGTWFTKFIGMVFFGPLGANMPRIGWLDGRTNVPAGQGNVAVAANKDFHYVRMHGDYEFCTYYNNASEASNYYKCIWGGDNSNPDKFITVCTASNYFNVASTVPGVTAYDGDREGFVESYIGSLFYGCEWRQRANKNVAAGHTRAARAAAWFDGAKAPQFYGGFINAADCDHAILLGIANGSIMHHFWSHGLHVEPTSCKYAIGLVNDDNLAIRGFYFNDHEPLVNTAIIDLNGYGNTILDFEYVGPCDEVPLFANGSSANVIGFVRDTAPGKHTMEDPNNPGTFIPLRINVDSLRRYRGRVRTQDISNVPGAVANTDYTVETQTYSGPIRGHQSFTVSSDTVNISSLDAGQVRLNSTSNRTINNIIRNNDWPLGLIIYVHIGGQGGQFTFNHLGNLNNGAIITSNAAPHAAGAYGTITLELISGAIVPGGPTYLWRQV